MAALTACNFPGDTDTWYVATTGDNSNDCLSVANPCYTIQGAIARADHGDTIIVAEGTYAEEYDVINDRNLYINKSVVLRGAGPGNTIVDGNGDGTAVIVNADLVTIEGMTITNGNNPPPYVEDPSRPRGGGVYNNNATLAIIDCVITGNIGGGIYNREGGLVVTNSTISDNTQAGGVWSLLGVVQINNSTITGNTAAHGGGIRMDGEDSSLTVSNSTISGNEAMGVGGGIGLDGTALISNSTISDNMAGDFGGGMWTEVGSFVMTNSTISGNSARVGGGIYKAWFGLWEGSITINHNTITENTAPEGGGGINNPDWEITISASIVAHNGETNCGGNLISGGNNLDSSDTCSFGAAGDLANTDPILGPLANNGGGTFTHALLPDSPAIDAMYHLECPASDQRGVERPQGADCDIGAFESEELGPQLVPGMPISTTPMPTATVTPMPEESECTITALVNLFCRPGPGYEPSDSFVPGQSATAFAQSPDGFYLFVYGPNFGKPCTVPDDPKYVEKEGEACGTLPQETLPSPPTPTFTPTATSPPPPQPLSAPTPISPTGTLNCADTTGGVTLTWSAVSHPNSIDHYEWVLEGPGPTQSGSTGATSVDIFPISCGASYSWRVRAVDGKGNIGPWSDYAQFTIG